MVVADGVVVACQCCYPKFVFVMKQLFVTGFVGLVDLIDISLLLKAWTFALLPQNAAATMRVTPLSTCERSFLLQSFVENLVNCRPSMHSTHCSAWTSACAMRSECSTFDSAGRTARAWPVWDILSGCARVC
jgi:hypothetical protein